MPYTASTIAWLAAFYLRFNFDLPDEWQQLMLDLLPWVLAIYAAIFLAMRLYRGLWRYASLPDLQRIAVAVGVAALAVPAVFAFVRIGLPVPRTVYVLTPLLVALAMGGDRLAYRAWREGRFVPVITKPQSTPVLVLGAGAAAAGLVRELAASRQWRVAGLLDDDAKKRGAEVGGVRVYGGIEQTPVVAQSLGVDIEAAQQLLNDEAALAVACKSAEIDRAAFSALIVLTRLDRDCRRAYAALDAFDAAA